MKILTLAPFTNQEQDILTKTFKHHQFIFSKSKNINQEMIDECDMIIGNPSKRFNLNKSSLKALQLASAGSDNYVKDGILHPDTKLANASGSYGKAISEHTIGMMLALNKNFKTYFKNMDNHLWQEVKTGKEIYHSTVIIVGLGDLGYQLAKRLKAFDCKIIGVKRRLGLKPEGIDELYSIDQLDSILPQGDYVILCLPQSKETINLFNYQRLSSMKQDAMIINVGRGSAINTNDLKTVLKNGHLYGAALDVIDPEPYFKDDELWDYPNVIITPHVSGGFVWPSVHEYFLQLVIRNIQHLENNESLENEVDFNTGYRKVVKYSNH